MRLTASSRAAPPRDPGMPRQHAVRGFRSIRRPVELPFAPDPGCTAQPRVHGSKFHINPSSWARGVPIPRLCLASPEVYRERPPALQSTCSCPSTPSPRLIRSRVSVVDLQRVPARCSIRPVRRSKLQVAACSRGDASHGLFLRHMHRAVRQDAREHITRILEYKTACRAPIRTCTELYGSATSAWAKVLP